MPEEPEDPIPLVLADDRELERAVTEAVMEALLRHKRAGNTVVVWEDGKIVHLKPEEI